MDKSKFSKKKGNDFFKGTLEYEERNKNMRGKNKVNSIVFPSPIKFSKLSLMFEANIIKMLGLVLNVFRGYILLITDQGIFA